MLTERTWLRWLPAISWGLIILALSLMPGGTGGFTFFGIPHFDKVGHFGMYAGWTFFILFGLQGYSGISGREKIMLSLAIGVGLGILLEFGQKWMHQGRSFERWDMVANAAGALTGTIVARLFIPAKV